MADPAAADKIKSLFSSADSSEDGRISRAELECTFRAIGDWTDTELDRLFQSADRNNDNFLDYKEFIDWILISTDDGPPRPSTCPPQSPNPGAFPKPKAPAGPAPKAGRPVQPKIAASPQAKQKSGKMKSSEEVDGTDTWRFTPQTEAETETDRANKEDEAARKIQAMHRRKVSEIHKSFDKKSKEAAIFSKAHEAQQKLSIVRGMVDQGITVAHVESALNHNFEAKPCEEEESFLEDLLNVVPLMQQTSRIMVKMRQKLFGDGKKEGEKFVLDPSAILETVTTSLHKMKMCTARSCWRQLLEEMEELKLAKTNYLKLKQAHRTMQTEYNREVTMLRDNLRKRNDPETGIHQPSAPDIIMYYEPMHHVENEWVGLIFQIVKEKLKMVFDHNPGMESICSMGQLNALKALNEGQRMSEMKEILKKKTKENEQLKLKVATMENDFKKLQRDSDNGRGCSQGAMLAMDQEVAKMQHDKMRLKKELDTLRTSLSRSEDQNKELGKTLQKYEEKEFEWDKQREDFEMHRDDYIKQISDCQCKKAEIAKKLEKSETHLKTAQSELKQIKQSIAKLRKIEKAEKQALEEYGDVAIEEGASLSGVSKKQLTEHQNELSSAVKELLAVSKQNEEELNHKLEENHDLQEQVHVLDDENQLLRQNIIDVVQECAYMMADSTIERALFSLSSSEELETAEMSSEKGEVQSAVELHSELQQTEEQIVSVVRELENFKYLATGQKAVGLETITKVREKQAELSKLHNTKMTLTSRLAMTALAELQMTGNDSQKTSEDDDASPEIKSTWSADVNGSQGSSKCPRCEEKEKKIGALQQALNVYKTQCKEITETLQQTTKENKAMNETLEKLQLQNHTLLMTLTSAKGLQNNPTVKACIALCSESRKMTVFDRLYADSCRRANKSDKHLAERRERQQRIESTLSLEPKWRPEPPSQVPPEFVPSEQSVASNPSKHSKEISKYRNFERLSEQPDSGQEVTVADLPPKRLSSNNTAHSLQESPGTSSKSRKEDDFLALAEKEKEPSNRSQPMPIEKEPECDSLGLAVFGNSPQSRRSASQRDVVMAALKQEPASGRVAKSPKPSKARGSRF